MQVLAPGQSRERDLSWLDLSDPAALTGDGKTLLFMEESGKNITPDRLPPRQRTGLFALCDSHLRRVVEILGPQWVIGIGGFAAERARLALGESVRVGTILHPSPASPAANRDWAGQVERQLKALGVW